MKHSRSFLKKYVKVFEYPSLNPKATDAGLIVFSGNGGDSLHVS